MKFDFSKFPIGSEAYSKRPMAFLDIVPGKILGGLVELALIETGNRVACERWQKTQLRNLLAMRLSGRLSGAIASDPNRQIPNLAHSRS